MATYEQRGDSTRVLVRRRGVYESRTFERKQEARAWGIAREAEILAEGGGAVPNKPFRALLERFRDSLPDSRRQDRIRINALLGLGRREPDPLILVRLPVLGPEHFAAWRDRRLQSVSPAAVRREWSVLSAACTLAVREWRWLRKNPMTTVARPEAPPARWRRVTEAEIDALMAVSGDRREGVIKHTQTARLSAAFRYGCETGMRCGEIVALRWADVDLDRRVAIVRVGKTRAAARDVPLSTAAIAIMRQMPAGEPGDKVFQISAPGTANTQFRKLVLRAGIDDLHFHDSRHEGITRLSACLNVLQLARAVGHADPKQLMTYYNESAEDAAKLLP